MIIDTNFNFYSDAKGGDPDSTSPTLKKYHQMLWSKALPNGHIFELSVKKGMYLYHKSELGEFFLGSDAITHSYKCHVRKKWLIEQIPKDEVQELYDFGSTIGAYTVFPNNRIDRMHTINQGRGVNSLIDDRFDLTLECIRRYYLKQQSPLHETLLRYSAFFNLFDTFIGYIEFFLLDDLLDHKQNVKFFLPFDEFKTRPTFSSPKDYLIYKRAVMEFIKLRNDRIETYSRPIPVKGSDENDNP